MAPFGTLRQSAHENQRRFYKTTDKRRPVTMDGDSSLFAPQDGKGRF
jgi:hypothetical protein